MYQIGDLSASDENTIIMIGGIPTDPLESMTWLADELNKINPSLRIIIFNMPYYENHFNIETTHETAKSQGRNLIIKKPLVLANLMLNQEFYIKNKELKLMNFLKL